MDDRRWGGDISNPNCIISQKKSGSRLTWLKLTHIGIFTSIDRISRRVNKELCENERSVPEMCAPNKPLKGLSEALYLLPGLLLLFYFQLFLAPLH